MMQDDETQVSLARRETKVQKALSLASLKPKDRPIVRKAANKTSKNKVADKSGSTARARGVAKVGKGSGNTGKSGKAPAERGGKLDGADRRDKDKDKQERDPLKPKKARSAYNFYLEKRIAQLKEEGQVEKHRDRFAQAAGEWRGMSFGERVPYEDMARADKDRHQKDLDTASKNLNAALATIVKHGQGMCSGIGFPGLTALDPKSPHEDVCAVCGQEGNLLCCDFCPATHHLTCLEPPMISLPSDDMQWACPACSAKVQAAEALISQQKLKRDRKEGNKRQRLSAGSSPPASPRGGGSPGEGAAFTIPKRRKEQKTALDRTAKEGSDGPRSSAEKRPQKEKKADRDRDRANGNSKPATMVKLPNQARIMPRVGLGLTNATSQESTSQDQDSGSYAAEKGPAKAMISLAQAAASVAANEAAAVAAAETAVETATLAAVPSGAGAASSALPGPAVTKTLGLKKLLNQRVQSDEASANSSVFSAKKLLKHRLLAARSNEEHHMPPQVASSTDSGESKNDSVVHRNRERHLDAQDTVRETQNGGLHESDGDGESKSCPGANGAFEYAGNNGSGVTLAGNEGSQIDVQGSNGDSLMDGQRTSDGPCKAIANGDGLRPADEKRSETSSADGAGSCRDARDCSPSNGRRMESCDLDGEGRKESPEYRRSAGMSASTAAEEKGTRVTDDADRLERGEEHDPDASASREDARSKGERRPQSCSPGRQRHEVHEMDRCSTGGANAAPDLRHLSNGDRSWQGETGSPESPRGRRKPENVFAHGGGTRDGEGAVRSEERRDASSPRDQQWGRDRSWRPEHSEGRGREGKLLAEGHRSRSGSQNGSSRIATRVRADSPVRGQAYARENDASNLDRRKDVRVNGGSRGDSTEEPWDSGVTERDAAGGRSGRVQLRDVWRHEREGDRERSLWPDAGVGGRLGSLPFHASGHADDRGRNGARSEGAEDRERRSGDELGGGRHGWAGRKRSLEAMHVGNGTGAASKKPSYWNGDIGSGRRVSRERQQGFHPTDVTAGARSDDDMRDYRPAEGPYDARHHPSLNARNRDDRHWSGVKHGRHDVANAGREGPAAIGPAHGTWNGSRDQTRASSRHAESGHQQTCNGRWGPQRGCRGGRGVWKARLARGEDYAQAGESRPPHGVRNNNTNSTTWRATGADKRWGDRREETSSFGSSPGVTWPGNAAGASIGEDAHSRHSRSKPHGGRTNEFGSSGCGSDGSRAENGGARNRGAHVSVYNASIRSEESSSLGAIPRGGGIDRRTRDPGFRPARPGSAGSRGGRGGHGAARSGENDYAKLAAPNVSSATVSASPQEAGSAGYASLAGARVSASTSRPRRSRSFDGGSDRRQRSPPRTTTTSSGRSGPLSFRSRGSSDSSGRLGGEGTRRADVGRPTRSQSLPRRLPVRRGGSPDRRGRTHGNADINAPAGVPGDDTHRSQWRPRGAWELHERHGMGPGRSGRRGRGRGGWGGGRGRLDGRSGRMRYATPDESRHWKETGASDRRDDIRRFRGGMGGSVFSGRGESLNRMPPSADRSGRSTFSGRPEFSGQVRTFGSGHARFGKMGP